MESNDPDLQDRGGRAVKIICHYSNMPAFVPPDHANKGLGGTENFAVYLAQAMVQQGHEVYFYNQAPVHNQEYSGIKWSNLEDFDPSQPADLLISFRMREIFQESVAAKQRVLILADTESVGLGSDVRTGRITAVVAVSAWQRDKIAAEEDLVTDPCWILSSNGINAIEFEDHVQKVPGTCIHTATPERGLGLLLDVWPDIESHEAVKASGLKPSLHLFSSFMGWGVSAAENEEMCRESYAKIDRMIASGLAIVNHKHTPAPELRSYQQQADLFLYITNFNETYCISLTESMAAGTVPVVSNRAALSRITHGVNGFLAGSPMSDALSEEHKREFVKLTVDALLMEDKFKERMRIRTTAKAMEHDYAKVAESLLAELVRRA